METFTTTSLSEIESAFVNALNNAFTGEEAICFANYPWMFANEMKSVEIDIIVIHRDFGLYVFEIKGYTAKNIEYVGEDGWALNDPPVRVKSPYHQLEYKLRSLLRVCQSRVSVPLNRSAYLVLPRSSKQDFDRTVLTSLQQNTIFENDLATGQLRGKLTQVSVTNKASQRLTDGDWQALKSVFTDKILVEDKSVAEPKVGEDSAKVGPVIETTNNTVHETIPDTESSTTESSTKCQIFISYRRSDAEMAAGRITDHLLRKFGKRNVFHDRVSLKPGQNFVEEINRTITSCDVVLVVIGRSWIDACTDDGARRLENPKDFVRLEVSIGLERRNEGQVILIPVLVEGAEMPRESALPIPLKELASIQAHQIETSRFWQDIEALISYIVEITELPEV
jgi:hypothetical protein